MAPSVKGFAMPASDEMIAGYRDGRDPNSPEPSANRTHSYRHGFANGRDDRCGQPRDTAANLRAQADAAMALDETYPQGYMS